MPEPLFKLNHYEVYKHEGEPESYGDGRYGNYDVYHEDNGVVELSTSTFVQAVSVAVELFQGEDALNDKLKKIIAENEKPTETGSKVTPLH